MATKRNYQFIGEFIDSTNSAKRLRQSGGLGRRRQGRGSYGEVSQRANALKKGSGACWRCRYLKKSCISADICEECTHNSGFWGLHPNLGCRRGELIALADHLFPDYPIQPQLDLAGSNARVALLDLIASVKDYISRLHKSGLLKSRLYSYLLDLIEEDAISSDEDPLLSPAFEYLLASLQLYDVLAQRQRESSSSDRTRLIGTMRTSIQRVLQQLDKVIRKKTNTAEILTIMFTLCVVTIGAEIRLECFSKATVDQATLQSYCQSVQTQWHDTVIALFSACKDLKVSGDIKESIFEITSWKLEYVGILADQAANYQKPHIMTELGTEGRLLWKLTTLHAKLFTACAEGNEALVRSIPKKEPRINLKYGAGWGALHWACNNGCRSVLELLLQRGENTFLQDVNGWTPLFTAVRNQQDEIVSMLLKSGVDVNTATTAGLTALHQAVERKHISTIRLLVDWNRGWHLPLDINRTNAREETALHLAVTSNNLDIVELLANSGADLKLFNIYGETAMHLAASNGFHEIIDTLLDHGAELDERDSYDATPLHKAAENGHEAAASLLFQRGADIKVMNRYLETPLFIAARKGHEKMVHFLLKKGSSARGTTRNGTTALHIAAENGHDAVVLLLLDNNADIAAVCDSGWTALYKSMAKGHETTMRLLVERGADIFRESISTVQVLCAAAGAGYVSVLCFLLEQRVEADSKDKEGQTPLSWAAENGHEALVKRLLKIDQVDADSRDSGGWTPLLWAARNGREAVVKLLLETGQVDVNSKDDVYDRAPLAWAARWGHEAVVKLLLETGQVGVDKDRDGMTPSSLAAQNGHEAVVKLLQIDEISRIKQVLS